MNAREVIRALKRHHAGARLHRIEWAFITELRVGINKTSNENAYARIAKERGENVDWDPLEDFDRRIDAFALHAQRDFTRAFEIKVDRADFLHELNDPRKRDAALALSNEYYFAAPYGLISPDEIPEEAGLAEVKVHQRGTFKDFVIVETVKAPRRDRQPLPWSFIVSIAARAA